MAPDDVILESLARARAALDAGVNPKSLRWILKRADADLKQRLQDVTGKGGAHTFTAAQVQSYRKQIALVTKYVEGRLSGLTHELSTKAVKTGIANTTKTLATLDAAFTGVSRPLMIAQAARIAGMVEGVDSSLLARHQSSIDRYGKAMIIETESLMARGMLTGLTQHAMIQLLLPKVGPGIFQKRHYAAERIVRTETAHAYNAANLQAIHEARNLDFPDLQKKIMATFDLRTAMDSVQVHGQIRPHDGLFQDGVGRQYQHPPARPNDREVVIPWRAHWPETDLSKPVASKDAATLLAAPEIAKGKPVGVAMTDAAQAVAGNKATSAQHQRIASMFQAAGAKISTKAAQAVEAQKSTVSYLATQAKAKAGLEAAKTKIMQVHAQEQIAAQAKTQLASTAEGKKAAAQAAQFQAAQAKVQAYKAKLGAESKQLTEKKASAIEGSVLTLDKKDHKAAIEMLKLAAKNDPATFGHLYAKHVGGGQLSPAFFKTLSGSPLSKVVPLAKKLGFEVPKKDGKPVMPAAPVWSKPYPKPIAMQGLTLKEVPGSGFSYLDVHDAQGVKLAYVKKYPTELVVDPPDPLKAKGWEKLVFAFGEETTAAHYAVNVSKAIQGAKVEIAAAQAAQKAKELATIAQFDPRKMPETVLGPLKLHPSTQQYLDEARKAITKVSANQLRQSDRDNVVDAYIKSLGDDDLRHAHERWSSAWYGSSKGARNKLGMAVVEDLTHAELKSVAKDIGFGGPVEKLQELARRKYAATQAALEARDKQDGTQREWLWLNRGVHSEQGIRARKDRQDSPHASVALQTVSSWTSKHDAAVSFAGGNGSSTGVVLRAAVHRSRVYSQYEQEKHPMRHFENESEYIVISPAKTEAFVSQDVGNPKNQDWGRDEGHGVSGKAPEYATWPKP